LKTDFTIINSLHGDLRIFKKLVYNKFSFDLVGLNIEDESQEYGACSFKINGKAIQFRVSKITPKKVGQFVTIWKRNEQGITQPFEETDQIDFIVISSRNGDNFGQFIFPKSVLVDKGIITGKNKEGKRGIRVYPSWDKPINKQAIKSQSWQIKYFENIQDNNPPEFSLTKELLT
jgi:hypothetical protein